MPDVIAEELTRLSIFRDLHPKQARRIAELIEERAAGEGEEIIHEGGHSGDFFIIFSGTAALTVRGKRRDTRGPGEFFGESAIIGHSQSYTVTTLDEMRFGAVDAKEFAELIQKEPSISMHILESLIARLDDFMTRPIGDLV